MNGVTDDRDEEVVEVIADERKMSMVDRAHIADGKARTGLQAMLLKVVGGMGDKQGALSRLKTLCKIDENTHVGLVEGPRSKSSMLKEFLLSIQNMLQEHQSVSVQPMFIY